MLLFCANAAGGARELIPVIKEAERQSLPHTVFCNAVTLPLFSNAEIPAEELILNSVAEAKDVLESRSVQTIIVGTTATPESERFLTAAAKELSVLSIAVLDEWYHYVFRFVDEANELGSYLPDLVCVQDELSKRLAVQEGLPEEILRITGSPALADLALRAKSFSEDPPDVPHVFSQAKDRPTLLFLSQPLKVAYGSKPGDSGTHGEFIGYNEEIVREDLATMLSSIGIDVFVLEKPHPSGIPKSPPETAENVEWEIFTETDPIWPLLWHADVIVGMSTKALLEAAMLGRKTISHQPNATDPYMCTAARLEMATLYTSKEDFAKDLPGLLQTHKTTELPKPPFADPSAPRKVLALIDQ